MSAEHGHGTFNSRCALSALNQLSRSLAVVGNQLLDIQAFNLSVNHSPLTANHHSIGTVCPAQQQR